MLKESPKLHQWLLLHYKLPPEPSARRVYIWRKLKRIGSILYQDAVWTLPRNPRTLEQFQWLLAEILEMEGEATLWEAQMALNEQEDGLVKLFVEQVDVVYSEIASKLRTLEPDLEALSRLYQQTRLKDYFNSELGRKVREALLSVRGDGV